jgi:hypothetical protein
MRAVAPKNLADSTRVGRGRRLEKRHHAAKMSKAMGFTGKLSIRFGSEMMEGGDVASERNPNEAEEAPS